MSSLARSLRDPLAQGDVVALVRAMLTRELGASVAAVSFAVTCPTSATWRRAFEEVARGGEVIVVRNVQRDPRFDRAWAERESLRDAIVAPLLFAGRGHGALLAGFTGPTRRHHASAVRGIAVLTAAALAAATHRSAERLRDVCGALARTMDLGEAAAVIASEVAPLLGAVDASLYTAAPRGGLRRVEPDGRSEARGPGARRARDAGRGDRVFASFEAACAHFGEGFVHVPLEIDRRPVGLLLLRFGEGGSALDRHTLLGSLVGPCAQAVDRAHLLEAERRTGERHRFLSRAAKVLHGSLDPQRTVTDLARACVPELADWCVIDLLDGDTLRRVAIHHSDPSRLRVWTELARRFPVQADLAQGVVAVVQTGRPTCTPVIVPDGSVEGFIATELGLRSAITVPVVGRGRTLGAISFLTAESGRTYGEADLIFAEELGRRVGLALENAMLYAEARVATQRAEEASRAKDEFLGVVSHELRTPLNAIVAWTQLLARKAGDPDVLSRGLEVILRNARTQTTIVDDILEMSRVIGGKLRIDLVPVDLTDVVNNAVDAVRPAARAKSLGLEVSLEDSLTVQGDFGRLQQVVWNLLANAIKFTPPGGRVHLGSKRVKRGDVECVRVEVTDTGCGIAESELPLVFHRFHQADSSTTRRAGGLGLGLAIVRSLVEAHGGRVTAHSSGLGEGATFAVELPAAERGTLVSPVPGRLRGVRVLVVDDEPDATEIARLVLCDEGASVQSAGSAAEALTLMGSFRPDVLVSDIVMPGEDGYALIGRVRALPGALGAVPAIAVTGHRPQNNRPLHDGYQLHLTKPLDAHALVCAVSDLVHGHAA